MLFPRVVFFLDFFFCHFVKLLLHYFFQFFWILFINIFGLLLGFSIGNLYKIILFYFYKSMVTSKILDNLIKTVIIFKSFNKSCHQFLMNYVILSEIILRFLYPYSGLFILIFMFL